MSHSSDFSYPDTKSFITAVQQAAAPDTGGALGDATQLIRHLGSINPPWLEEACFDLLRSTHMVIRLALAHSLLYISDSDPELERRLLKRLREDESASVRQAVADEQTFETVAGSQEPPPRNAM